MANAMKQPMITGAAFDAAFGRPAPRVEKLWGRPAIARVLGVSEDTVAKWARETGVPIYQPRRGTYFALRSELETWLKTKVTC